MQEYWIFYHLWNRHTIVGERDECTLVGGGGGVFHDSFSLHESGKDLFSTDISNCSELVHVLIPFSLLPEN